ncbi:MAG: hypothetical protein J7M18_01085, partial [Candidatus Eremiobacteraeota bacterium]|nr:hypothetical protein [Candidatus Eremiobacteraeota bacterium]
MFKKDIFEKNLGPREIISGGTGLFIQDIKHFLGIWFLIWVPVEILIAILAIMANADAHLYFQIYLFVSIFFGILATLAVPFIVEKNVLNEPSNMWEAIRSSILKWIPALLTGILSIIVVILGTVFLI